MERIKLFTKKYYSRINFKKKRTWAILAIVLIVLLYLIFKPNSNIANIITSTASYTDIKQTVLATGQVTSKTDLNLSFNSSGVVKSLNVKVGDKVTPGQVLAALDQGSELASLTSARGTLAAANARLKRVLEGAEVTLARITLENAKTNYENVKKAQETLVKNAYNNLLSSTPEAVPENGTDDYEAPVISGSYILGKEGIINLNLYYSSGGISFTTSGLVEGNGSSNEITAQPIGNSGLYITFPSSETMTVREWIIEIPNKKASNYLTNYNAYQSALKTEEGALSQAEATLNQSQAQFDLKIVTASGSDIDLAQADILSAEGQYQQALSKYNNTVIKAPVEGTITLVDVKIGELAQALSRIIVLQDVSNIYLEANINEANITSLSLGMPIDITFDAFGTEKIFKGNITNIDPSSTLVSGVVNYKVTASVEKVEGLRPGMTANMTIKAKEKSHVITAPSRSVLTAKDGTKTIRLITQSKSKKYKEVKVTTGIEGDGGLVEITSGLSEGDEFVTLIKN